MRRFLDRLAWKRGLAGLLAAVLLTGSLEQLAYAEPAAADTKDLTLSGLLEQLGGSLENDLEPSVKDGVYADDAEKMSIAGAVYGLPVKISAAVAGAPGTGDSRSASVSADGRFVAFASASTNLVDGDTNGKQDIFLQDRETGTTKRISRGAGGSQADGDSYAPFVSFDGTYVLFTSKAQNLISGDANFYEDLFLYDAKSEAVQRVAQYVPGSEFAGAGSSYQVSADGRYVVYAGKTSSQGTCDIWLLDRRSGKVRLVARQFYIYETFRSRLSISADGRYVAFDSFSKEIVPDDVGGNYSYKYRDVYLYDAALNEMKKISRAPNGTTGNNYSYYPAISADGNYVAYLSKASNIVAADTKPAQDVYVYSRQTGTTELVSLDGTGAQPGVDAYDPSISADGRYVSFHTDGAYDESDTGRTDVYVRDRIAGTTIRVSKTAGGANADQPADRGTLSADGGTMVFETAATNMAESADPDAYRDIYAVALNTGAEAPAWPDGAAVTAEPGGTYVALSWPAVPGAAYYKVLQDGRFAGIVTGTSFAADGLALGSPHRYQVAAGTAGYAWSAWSPEVEAQTLGAKETNAPGTSAAAVVPVLGGAQVSWSYPGDRDIVGAKVRWRKPGGAAFESPLYPKSVVSALVPNLENGEFYEFAIAIVDGDGNAGSGEWSRVKLPSGPAVVRMDVLRGTGGPAGSQNVYVADMNGDGRYTLFTSDMHFLVPEDDRTAPYNSYSSTTQLYLYDSELGSVRLISRTWDGKLGNGSSGGASISADGRYIVFGSAASNLLEDAPDTNGKWDVFLMDRDVNGNGTFDEQGDTSLSKISTPYVNGGQANGDSSGPVISADGSTIIFSTNAKNLVDEPPTDTNYYNVIMSTAAREPEALVLPNGKSPGASSGSLDLSADGKTIAFNTYYSFDEEDTGSDSDIYWYDWHDPDDKKLVWISGMIQDRKYSNEIKLDASGKIAVFNMMLQNNQYQTYVFDANAPPGTIPAPLIEVPIESSTSLDYITATAISADGRQVLFESSGKDIVPGLSGNYTRVYSWDRIAKKASLVSQPYDPALAATSSAFKSRMSGDGTRAAYVSTMINMVRGSERAEYSYGAYIQRIALAAPAASWPAGSSLTASDVGKNSVKLTWTAAANATGGYRVAGGPTPVEVPVGTLETVVTGLSPSTDYNFAVQASAAGGVWTADGPTATARTTADTGLADLTLSLQAGEVRLAWGEPSAGAGIAAFRIVRKTGGSEWTTVATVSDAAARGYADRTALSGRTYTYAVHSLDAAGTESPYSVEKTIAVGGTDIASFTYAMPFYNRQHVGQEDTIALKLVAPSGAEANATLSYKDKNGIARTAESELAESAQPGVYEGRLTIPKFAVSLDSILGKMTYEGVSDEAEALQKPIVVGGTVKVALEAGSEIPFDSLLTLYSKKAAAYRTVTLNGALEASFKGLPAADDYKLTLIGAGGLDLLEESQVPPIAAEAGGNHEASTKPQLPAQLSLAVSYPSGSAPNVQVLVSDESGATLASGVTPFNGNLSFPAFKGMIGKTVTIRAIPGDAQYAPLEQSLTLVSGRNRAELHPALKTEATFKGTVSDMNGLPVRGATVQVTFRGSYYTAMTDDAGKYTVNAPAGEVYVQAQVGGSFSSGWIKTEAVAGQTQTLNIEYKQRIPAIVRLNLYTESENGMWIGPYDLDWREMVHYHVYAKEGMVSSGNPMLVYAEAGQKVTVCANGYEAGYASTCVEAMIGQDLRGEATIRLENKISKVAGNVSDVPATLTVYRLDGANRSYVKSEGVPADGDFNVALPGAGTYELRVAAGGGKSLLRTFTVADRDSVDLGELKPTLGGAFAGQSGNAVLLGTTRPAPGTALQVRASYANVTYAQIGGAALVLDVPAETTLVPDSVIWNGKPVTPTLENGRYVVQMGTIPGRGAGTLQYQLQIADEPEARELDVSPRIRYDAEGSQQEEELGTARASLSQVTISAPSRTAFRAFVVTGSAPSDSQVAVQAGDKIVATADASPNGRWSASVEMPGEGKTADWQLRAVASLNGKTWSSEAAGVSFDEGIAEPIEFTMKQSDGRTIRLDPRGGATRFPYVFAPGLPFVLTLKFNHPELAKDVAFYIGETRVPASLKDGVYQAVLNGISDPGAIGVDYETSESPASLDPTPPTPTEIRDQLPQPFRDAVREDLVVSPRSDGDRSQSMSYKGKLPASVGDAKLTMNATLERTSYTPSANDLSLEQETGVPAYGVNLKQSFSGGVLRLELTGYLPDDQFAAGLDASKAMALLAAGAENKIYAGMASEIGGGKKSAAVHTLNGAVRVVAARVAMAFESTAGENTWKTIDAAYSIYDGRGSGDTLADLEYLMDKVARYCDPHLVPAYMDHINFLKNHLIAVELTKAAIMVAGAVAGPATFGLGTIALFLVSNAAGKVLDGQLAGMVANLNRDIDSNPYCKIPKKPKKQIADPEWIYDPSGYVYEMTEDRRIEGVKATVLRWNESTSRWDVWDADWYGQDNPLYTDAEGRYAWDVPKGKWKVLFEKEGYLSAESEELTVLPPHFDVNVAMISTLPAKPVRVEAAPGGASVDILFDRHVKGDAIGADLLKVIDPEDGGEIAGVWTAIDPVADGSARHVRFVPDQPLREGAAYKVGVDAALQSYAGIPLGEAFETEVDVSETDTTPPAAVTSLEAEADGSQALVAWRDAADPDTAKVVVSYKAQGAESGKTVDVHAGQKFALLTGLNANTSYDIEVRAYDAAGNYSAARTTAGTAGAQPVSGDIAPPGPVTVGTVAPGVDTVSLTWQDPADGDLSGIGLQWAAEGQEMTLEPVRVSKGVGKYAIAGLSPSKSYEIRIWTIDDAGNASPAQTLFVTTKAAGGGTGGGPGNPGGNPQDPSQQDAESGEVGAEGGTLSFFGGKLKLWLPGSGGAAGAAKKVTAAKVSGSPTPADAHLKLVSDVYAWKLEAGGTLAAPGKLTIAYDAAKLAGADIRKLGLYRQDAGDKSKWTYAGGIVDGASGSVESAVMEPGTYAVLIAEYSFGDMANHWSRADVEVLAARGIVSGDPAGTFRPNGSVTRAEFVKLVLPLLAGGAGPGVAAERFADVPADAWYAEAVATATAAGIVQGAGGKFRPNDPVTREEMAVMLFRAQGIAPDIKLNADALLSAYGDGSKVSKWARMQVAYGVQSGLLKGSGGKLNPGATATRAEAATVVLRALGALGRITKKS